MKEKIRNGTEIIDNPIKYAGEYYDDELDMIYLRARYYDPHIGRFTSLDIKEGDISNPLDMNRYVYCRNNPIKYVDPTGEFTLSISAGVALLSEAVPYIVAGVSVIVKTIYYAKGKSKTPTPPSKLRDGDKVKTPDSHPKEWNKNKDGSYTHKKTGWTAEKAKGGGRHGGEHWDLSPGLGSGHINVGPAGNIF